MFVVAALSGALLGWLLGFLSLFLVLLILVQRGKGGGLTGALGGPGGQSAFGSKAGDTFTFITVVVACIWGFVCAFTMWLLGTHTPNVTLSNTNLSAGPGDDSENDFVIPPPMGGDSIGSDSIGGVSSDTTDAESTQRNALDGTQGRRDTRRPRLPETGEAEGIGFRIGGLDR